MIVRNRRQTTWLSKGQTAPGRWKEKIEKLRNVPETGLRYGLR